MRAFANEPVETSADTHEPSGRNTAVRPTNPTRDEARLLVQSPTKLFFYWNFARDPRPALNATLGDAAGKLRPAVRLVETGGDWEGEPSAAGGDENSFWFDALPGRSYRAEFGFHAAGLPFVRLLSSNVAETPAAGASAESDPAPEFGIDEREFTRLLEGSGFKHARRPASSGTLAARTNVSGD